jgi:GTP-binding protein Era
METHKAGFVSIIGRPNVGKSTLMNALMGEKISIITPKVQTTRHRILGILSKPDYQLVFSDTPGIIQPRYKLHSSMMEFVNQSLQDADVVLFIADNEPFTAEDEAIFEKLKLIKTPVIVLLNKIDLMKSNDEVLKKVSEINQRIQTTDCIPLSALNKFNIDLLVSAILKYIPNGPSFYPDDQLTDKSERFVAAEILREKIMMRYKEEIPYSVQVEIEEFKEEDTIIRISAIIYVMRDSQKQILIGKSGIAIKNTGIAARRDMEKFFGKKIFLQTFVKVKEDWRDNDNVLKAFGYKE